MKVGDLVINVYTKKVGIITEEDVCPQYVIVENRWKCPKEHLRVVNDY